MDKQGLEIYRLEDKIDLLKEDLENETHQRDLYTLEQFKKNE